MDWPTIITAAVGGGGLTAALFPFLLNRKKQDYAQRIAVEKQASETLQAELARQSLRIDKLETANAKCMEGHIDEARKTGKLEGRIDEQSVTIANQTTIIAQQNSTIAKLQADLDIYTKKAGPASS